MIFKKKRKRRITVQNTFLTKYCKTRQVVFTWVNEFE